ncbi:hypothetical protein LUZ60_010291 [Juncus effusus]|nr:hypothetical protein LUZ60_010291 [Juncus effusus]
MMRKCSVSSLRSLLLNLSSPKPHLYSRIHHFHFSPILTTLSPNSTINGNHLLSSSLGTPSLIESRFLSTRREERDDISDETEEDQESAVEWEEEEESDPVIGDGGDGGGVVLGGLIWGERALKIAYEILSDHFGDDVALYAFKVSPKGYVYLRLDKLTDKYGCPSIEEIESFNNLFKERLDETIEKGDITLDLAIEVSSPGAERLIKIPNDLDRFKDMPMHVQYIEPDSSEKQQEKERVLLLESFDNETRICVWKLADVKENREEAGKGRPLNRKQKDWRLRVSFEAMKRVMLYLHSM